MGQVESASLQQNIDSKRTFSPGPHLEQLVSPGPHLEELVSPSPHHRRLQHILQLHLMMNGYLARLTRLLLADSRVDQITPGYYCTLPRDMAKRRNNMALSRNSSMDGSMDEVTLYSHI